MHAAKVTFPLLYYSVLCIATGVLFRSHWYFSRVCCIECGVWVISSGVGGREAGELEDRTYQQCCRMTLCSERQYMHVDFKANKGHQLLSS